VCRNSNGDREYIQTTWTAKEQAIFEREMHPFKLIKDFNKRTLLTTDIELITTYKEIHKLNVID